jgi:DNA polymerase-1
MIAADIAGITRKLAKTLGFAVLYGAGVGRIAEQLEISVAEATAIKAKYLRAMPEIKQFSQELSRLAQVGRPIETLAGRQYFVESPKVIQGRLRTFEYKLTNYKIQGSAADQTKEAMFRYATSTKHGMLSLSVHDQLVAAVPKELATEEMQILENAMNGAFQDVLKYQIISDPAIADNFGDLK